MKLYLTLLALILSTFVTNAAGAYRLIMIPTANVLNPGELRLEAQGPDFTTSRASLSRLDCGVQGGFEIQIAHRDLAGDKRTFLSLEKQFTSETGLTPAFSLGMINITDTIEKGISPYFVGSMRVPIGIFPGSPFRDVHIHWGVGGGYFQGGFMGVSARLPLKLGVEVEHDSHGINIAATWQPIRAIRARLISINGDRAYSVIFAPPVRL